MGKSTNRVRSAAAGLGLDIHITAMPESTRTAAGAARACGCAEAQIVKSLIFERRDNGALVLILVAGDRQLDLDAAARDVGAPLQRADARKVREITGFAIGGVAPLGHLNPLPVFADPSLLEHAMVWAAAGAPNALFEVDPKALMSAIGATLMCVDAGGWPRRSCLQDKMTLF